MGIHPYKKNLTSQKQAHSLFYSPSNATMAHSSPVHSGVPYVVTNPGGMRSKNIRYILSNNISITQMINKYNNNNI